MTTTAAEPEAETTSFSSNSSNSSSSSISTDRAPALPPSVEHAQSLARAEGLPFAGSLPPETAFELINGEQAILVDVRTLEERKFVGHVPQSLHVPWATGTALNRNPRFARELAALIAKQTAAWHGDAPAPHPPLVTLLLCRSGKRSALAAEEAAKAGIPLVFNVSEGFEGDLNLAEQRGRFNGWRFHGLPWVQD